MAFTQQDLIKIMNDAKNNKEEINKKISELPHADLVVASELYRQHLDKELLNKSSPDKSSISAPATQIPVENIEKYFGDKQKYKIDYDDQKNMVVSRIDTSGKETEIKPFLTVENNPDSKNCTIHTNGECSKEEYKGMINAIRDSRTGENKNKPIFLWHENKDELEKMKKAAEEAGVNYKATLSKEEFDSPEWKKAALAQPDKDKTLDIRPVENTAPKPGN